MALATFGARPICGNADGGGEAGGRGVGTSCKVGENEEPHSLPHEVDRFAGMARRVRREETTRRK